MNGASSGNDSDGDWQPTMSAATAVADRADRTAMQGQVGLVSMMSMDEEEQSAEAKQCLKALKEGKRCRAYCCRPPEDNQLKLVVMQAGARAAMRWLGIEKVLNPHCCSVSREAPGRRVGPVRNDGDSFTSDPARKLSRLQAPQLQRLFTHRNHGGASARRLLKDRHGAPAMVRFEKALMLAKFLGNRVQERRAVRGLAAAARIQARASQRGCTASRSRSWPSIAGGRASACCPLGTASLGWLAAADTKLRMPHAAMCVKHQSV